MVERWYDLLPAAWFTPQGKWFLIMSIMLIFLIGFTCGFLFHIFKTNHWLIKHGYKPRNFFNPK